MGLRLRLRLWSGAEVRLDLAPGEGAVLTGDAGSGKTAVLRAVAGLEAHGRVTGTAVLGDVAWEPAGPVPARVAWVTQDPVRHLLGARVADEIGEAAARALGLDPDHHPRRLSRGEAWRVALERALGQRPRVLLVDEPSASLDGPGLAWMRERLRRFVAGGGILLAAEHRPEALGWPRLQRVPLGCEDPAPARAQSKVEACAPVAVAHGLRVRVGRRHVGPLDLEVRPGERVGLTSPNGWGKSTLLRAMAGLGRHTGELVRPRRVAWLPQDPDEVLYRPTVRAELAGVHPELVALLGVRADLDADPLALSPGQRQAVALAASLAGEPTLVLLDEPTGWLDPAAEGRVLDALAWLQARGAAVVIASHDRAALLRWCHRVADLPWPETVTCGGTSLPARGDLAVGGRLALGLLAVATVALTPDLLTLWWQVSVLFVASFLLPRGLRRARGVARRAGVLLVVAGGVLSLVFGPAEGVPLALRSVGKVLGAWLPVLLVLRSVRQRDLEHLLRRVAGQRWGQALAVGVSALPLLESSLGRTLDQVRVRGLRSPMAVLTPLAVRVVELAHDQADALALQGGR